MYPDDIAVARQHDRHRPERLAAHARAIRENIGDVSMEIDRSQLENHLSVLRPQLAREAAAVEA